MIATSEQVITGLFVALFNRAPESFELNYWLRQIGGGNDLTTFNHLTSDMVEHPQFTKVFGFMSNQEFVENIFFNISGETCDQECLSYWVADLNNGLTRSSFLAALIYSLLNLNTKQPSGLSLKQLENAKLQRNNLQIRVEKALRYTHFYALQSKIRTRK